MARERFDSDMQNIHERIVAMSSVSIRQLDKAVDALLTQDIRASLNILEEDVDLNILEMEINDRVELLIAKQQPVATDLRRLIVFTKIASDLERIGDYAVNIAKETIRLGRDVLPDHLPLIDSMRKKTIAMLHGIIEAYEEEDTLRAKAIADLDDEVDALYGELLQKIITFSALQPEAAGQVTQLAFVARDLERAADHATLIAEQLFYLVKGRRFELN